MPKKLILLTLLFLITFGSPFTGTLRMKKHEGFQKSTILYSKATNGAHWVQPAFPLKLIRNLHGHPSRVPLHSTQLDSAWDLDTSLKNFFTKYNQFGVQNPIAQLKLIKVAEDTHLNEVFHFRFQQVHKDIEVFGASLHVHVQGNDSQAHINMVNGHFVPDLEEVDTIPKLSKEEARKIAIDYVRSLHENLDPLDVAEEALCIYRTNMTNDLPGSNYLAFKILVQTVTKFEGGMPIKDGLSVLSLQEAILQLKQEGRQVMSIEESISPQKSEEESSPIAVKYLVFVNAHTGRVIDSINQLHSALRRIIYNQSPNAPFWEEGDKFPTKNTQANNLISMSGIAYNTFLNLLPKADSFDQKGGEMIALFNLRDPKGEVGCPINAFWNGEAIFTCPSMALSDIIAHEWGHAYTQYSHNLIYQYQSGALNEAYSDIIAESIQQLYEIPVADPPRDDFQCIAAKYPNGIYQPNAGLKWIVGDSIPSSFGIKTGLRDMYNPNCNSNPRAVGDPFFYCGSQDNGGVHYNSGVPNQAFSLLADGGSLNGATVQGIGVLKALQIYLYAMFNIQTSSTTFSQHVQALKTSCTNLKGVPLRDVEGKVTQQVVTEDDCQQLENAISAVKLTETVCSQGDKPVAGKPVIFDGFPSATPLLTEEQIKKFSLAPSVFLLANNVDYSAKCRYSNADPADSVVYGADYVKEVMCPFPIGNSPTTELVGLSNGDDVSNEALQYQYYEFPQIDSISPTEGPAGTVIHIYGKGFQEFTGCNPSDLTDYNGDFADCLVCLFGEFEWEFPVKATLFSDTEVTCKIPPKESLITEIEDNKYDLSFSMNAQIYQLRLTEIVLSGSSVCNAWAVLIFICFILSLQAN